MAACRSRWPWTRLRVWDVNGKEYLDALGGIAEHFPGPQPCQAGTRAAAPAPQLIHTSNHTTCLCRSSLPPLGGTLGHEQVFFCNSGPGGQRGRARLHAVQVDGASPGLRSWCTKKPSTAGRSIATMSATGNPKIHNGFGPLVEGFIRVPMNDIAAIKAATGATPTWWRCFETIRAKAA